MNSTKKCSRCKIHKPISEFYKNKAQGDGFDYYCIPCKKDYQLLNYDKTANQKYYQANRLDAIAKRRVHKARIKTKELGCDGDHTLQDHIRLFEEQEGLCAYCNCELSDDNKTIDHIIPLTRNGTNNPDNICWACRSCNSSKHDNFISEWDGYSPTWKFCKKCQTKKPLSGFNTKYYKNGRLGYRHPCKSCKLDYERDYRRRRNAQQ